MSTTNPVHSNQTAYRGNTFAFLYAVTAGGSPVDLAADYADIQFRVFKPGREESPELDYKVSSGELAITNTNELSGTIDADTTIDLFGQVLFYELRFHFADGSVEAYVRGRLFINNASSGGESSAEYSLKVDQTTNQIEIGELANVAALATQAKVDAEAAAAGVNLPSIESGDKFKELIVKQDESGHGLFEKAFVNPKWFGAKGDGVTDDTAAIDDALAYSDIVFIPKGEFLYSGKTLTISARKSLFSLNREGTLKLRSGAKVSVEANGSTLRSLTIDADASTITADAGIVELHAKGRVFDCEIDGGVAVGSGETRNVGGVVFYSGSDHSKVHGNYIHNVPDSLIENVHMGDYAEFLSVKGNRCHDSEDSDGITLDTSYSIIDGNRITGKWEQCICLYSFDSSRVQMRYNTISNNYIEFSSALDPNTNGGQGILISSSVTTKPEYCTVKNNTINGWGLSHGDHAIYAGGKGHVISHNKIVNGPGGTGIETLFGDALIVGNKIFEGTGVVTGIYARGDSDRVFGNTVHATTSGIRSGGNKQVVCDNTVTTTLNGAVSIGIEVNGSLSDTDVVGNTIYSQGDQGYGISLESGGQSDVRVRNNLVKECSNSAIYLRGTNASAIGNTIYNAGGSAIHCAELEGDVTVKDNKNLSTGKIYFRTTVSATNIYCKDNKLNGQLIDIGAATFDLAVISGNEDYTTSGFSNPTRLLENGLGSNGSTDPATGGVWNGNEFNGLRVKWDDGAGNDYLSIYQDGWFNMTLS